MDELEGLVKTTMGEIERLVNTKTLVGDPIIIGENTLIPLISVNFGFGAGANAGVNLLKQKGEMSGSATGGGAQIKPVAVIIVDKEGAWVEPIMSGVSGALEKLSETAPKAIEKLWESRKEKKEEEKEK